jgi:hypothetical protein
VTRVKAGAAVLVLLAALAAGGAAAARTPTPSQKAAIVAAMRSEQGNVAIQKVLVSTANPSFASMKWGFANNGFSALHSSLLGMAKGEWKVLWTRDFEAPADGACVYAPAPVARDLFNVSCPPPALHARAATKVERKGSSPGSARATSPVLKNALSLSPLCVSRVNRSWAGGVASSSRVAPSTSSSGTRRMEARVRVPAPADAAAARRDRALTRLLRRLHNRPTTTLRVAVWRLPAGRSRRVRPLGSAGRARAPARSPHAGPRTPHA